MQKDDPAVVRRTTDWDLAAGRAKALKAGRLSTMLAWVLGGRRLHTLRSHHYPHNRRRLEAAAGGLRDLGTSRHGGLADAALESQFESLSTLNYALYDVKICDVVLL